MKVLGITSRLPQKIRLFMFEFDDVSEYDALEEANFLSQVFDLDLYVLESSPRHYHLISFDILTIETVERIQNWITLRGDYLTVKEQNIDRKGSYNCLRIGSKGKKPAPKFIKAFYAKHDLRLKSLNHFLVYRALCGVEEPPRDRLSYFKQFNACEVTVYNTGIGARHRKKPSWET
jgi:hypothetical protein